MNVADILEALGADGIKVELVGDNIMLAGSSETVGRWRGTVAERKMEIIDVLKVGASDTASTWWLLHYPDRDPMEVACCPEATHAEILERHPDAVAAEPITPTIRRPSAPMRVSEETAIRAWLALIEETDPATIAEVVGQCQRDADARNYFTRRAATELPKPNPFTDDPTPEWCIKRRRQ